MTIRDGREPESINGCEPRIAADAQAFGIAVLIAAGMICILAVCAYVWKVVA